MRNAQTAAIELALRDLIPGVAVETEFRADATDLPTPLRSIGTRTSGMMIRPDGVRLWYQLPDDRFCVLHLKRLASFSSAERTILRQFPATISSLMRQGRWKSGGDKGASREITREAFASILVARYVRGGRPQGSFYGPSLIISLLQRLSFQKYEGAPCSSGFLYTSEIGRLGKEICIPNYQFEQFDEPIQITDGFFEEPLSHRYVDGRNGFYVFNNSLAVFGLLRCLNPEEFPRLRRAAHGHILPVLKRIPSRAWLAYVGRNAEVTVVKHNGAFVRWVKGSWTITDPAVTRQLLNREGVEDSLAEDLLEVLFTISDLRLGTVILVPSDRERRPRTAATIDRSALAQALIETFRNRRLRDLVDTNLAIGLLTSDGLTTISPSGEILGCGEIIAVGEPEAEEVAGGGRTQAALKASKYGLTVKVSEDGPITFFKDGRVILSIR